MTEQWKRWSLTNLSPSKISGLGTFATIDIPAGQTIRTLSGKEIHCDDIESRPTIDVRPDDELQIGIHVSLILDRSSYYINHSCQPTAGIKKTSELFALTDIKEGEEITFDYSTTVGTKDSWRMQCKYETQNCRGTIGNVLSIPVPERMKYLMSGALPDFILDELSTLKKWTRTSILAFQDAKPLIP